MCCLAVEKGNLVELQVAGLLAEVEQEKLDLRHFVHHKWQSIHLEMLLRKQGLTRSSVADHTKAEHLTVYVYILTEALKQYSHLSNHLDCSPEAEPQAAVSKQFHCMSSVCCR